MPKFRFQLEAVLKQRRAVELEKQLAVARLEAERIGMEERIRGYQAEIVREKEELREQLDRERADQDTGVGVRVDLRGVRFQMAAGLRLVGKAQHAVIQLAGIHRRLDAARLELLHATTRRKAVETLRERRLEAWKAEQSRAEALSMDEINVIRAGRRNAEGQGSMEDAA